MDPEDPLILTHTLLLVLVHLASLTVLTTTEDSDSGPK